MKIRTISDSDLGRITVEEVQAQWKNRLSHTHFTPKGDVEYLLGMPVFYGMPYKSKSPMVIPVGQHCLALEVLKQYSMKQEMVRRLISEYRSIAQTLMGMKIDFGILNLENGEEPIRSWLLEKKCRNVEFPMEKPTHWHAFPRDMFVYLGPVKTILVHSKLFKLQRDRSRTCNILHTELAEGGQVLFSDSLMIVGCHPEIIDRKKDHRVFKQLKEMGMNTILIPYAIFFALSRERRGKPFSTFYESHLDRSAGLLKGKDGRTYLVLDPYYRTGKLLDPLSVQKSIDLVRKFCGENGVEVRVPESITVPYGTSAVQFENGKVIMTGKDEEVFSTFAGIVGSENLEGTDIAISAYPVFTGAGLHCLITERPTPLA